MPLRAHRGPVSKSKREEERGRRPREASVSRVSDEEKRERRLCGWLTVRGKGEGDTVGLFPGPPLHGPPTVPALGLR